MPPSNKETSGEGRRVILDGKDLQTWFKFDRQALRWCRRKFGDVLGPRLWNDDFRALDEHTVTGIAQDVYDNMLRVDGFKEAQSYYEWDWFWTVEYQRQERESMVGKLYDFIEENSDGKALAVPHN